MTPYEVYSQYISLKNHFTQESYDYFKYNGKSTTNPLSFNKRKDKIYFEKLSKHDNPFELILSNIILNKKIWIRDLAYSDTTQKVYEDWKKRTQSLTYTITNECNEMIHPFDDNFKILDNQHPNILRLYLAESISLETFVVLVSIVQCERYWSKVLKDDIIWKEIQFLYKKYLPFLSYDKDKIAKKLIDKFT
jgi:hypothetical protein